MMAYAVEPYPGDIVMSNFSHLSMKKTITSENLSELPKIVDGKSTVKFSTDKLTQPGTYFFQYENTFVDGQPYGGCLYSVLVSEDARSAHGYPLNSYSSCNIAIHRFEERVGYVITMSVIDKS